jgi:hypothetical protein
MKKKYLFSNYYYCLGIERESRIQKTKDNENIARIDNIFISD